MLTATRKPARQKTTLLERVLSSPRKIDKANGVIYGVRILGRVSANGREYSPEAMRQAAKLYEGCKVHFDHPPANRPGMARSVKDWIGELRCIRTTADAVYGDLHLIASHPHARAVMEAAEKFPTKFGLSHNADGASRESKGRRIVESVTAVRSVDLVGNPATNHSLFENLLEMDGMADRPVLKDRKGRQIAENGKIVSPNGKPMDWAETAPAEDESVDQFLKRITPKGERKAATKPNLEAERQASFLRVMQAQRQ